MTDRVPARWYDVQLHSMHVPPEVVFRELSQETVLLNVKSGQYHGVDAIGSRFFEVMRSAANVAAACEQLAREFEQPPERIRSDFLDFADALSARGLLVLVAPS